MQLSRQFLKDIVPLPGLTIPDEKLFDLPEKVLQFGTGVLLRGLPDYFIDKANRAGIFNGRIVIVKSTSTGGTDAFSKQDSLYTTCVRGLEEGKVIDETIINSSVSRVLSAKDDWAAILQIAHNPDMQLIVSNTTEVGIVLVDEDIRSVPPKSFPAKLLAFLYERFKAFSGSPGSGMVIIPTELIIDNGDKLYEIAVQLAKMNKLEDGFIQWLGSANHFCSSLVDRIVPGQLTDEDKANLEKKFGFKDELAIMAESFRLWAIESGNENVKNILSFSQVDEGVVIAGDIEKFRELKLRLLNGTHTFSCGLAFLAGFTTVKEAYGNEYMSSFTNQLMMNEIAPAISNGLISYTEACAFAKKVMERFRNPYLDHDWINITVQFTSKMKLRNIPLLLKHYEKKGTTPVNMSLGFAAYLLFMKGKKDAKGQYTGEAFSIEYPIRDDHAAYFAEKWEDPDPDSLVDAVLSDKDLWGTNLSMLNGFADLVKAELRSLVHNGVMATFRRGKLNKVTV